MKIIIRRHDNHSEEYNQVKSLSTTYNDTEGILGLLMKRSGEVGVLTEYTAVSLYKGETIEIMRTDGG